MEPAFETFRLRTATAPDGTPHEVVVDHLPGAGPAWVYMHGLGSTRLGEKSEALARRAAARGRAFVRFDFSGHGGSSGALSETTISQLVVDTRAVLDHVGPAVVFGSSLGGIVGAWTAARHAVLVRALVLVAPALGFLPRMAARPREGHFVLVTGPDQEWRIADRVLDDAARHDERELPGRLTMPTMLVHGTEDEVVPVALSDALHADLQATGRPPATLDYWRLEGGDHRLNAPIEAILDRMEAFLDRHDLA